MKKKKLLSVLMAVALSCSLFTAVPVVSQAAGTTGVTMYRLYNPNSGEHLYTNNSGEKDILTSIGWTYEGIAWTAPASSNTPVYRLYNPNSGEHHYTKDAGEKGILVGLGWNDEGIGWYSDDSQSTPLYRLYNPYATGQYEAGAHHYTKDVGERDTLIGLGWNDEGIGWYGVTSPDSKYSPGDIVILGSYEQDNNLSNGAEPIEWIVVGERDGHTLILSKYALDYRRYNEESFKDITWEDCTLRAWLNSDFYNMAFSASDKGRIATAHNENPDTYELYKDYHVYNYNDIIWGAKGGNATDDKVFLLSWTEARDYFDAKGLYNYYLGAENYNQKLLCRPTAYAKGQGIGSFDNRDNIYPSETVGCCGWWLRSPGPDQTGFNASSVVYDGSLSHGGDNSDGGWNGVRPAILID